MEALQSHRIESIDITGIEGAPLSHIAQSIPFLSVDDCLTLDTAITSHEHRPHLLKSYAGIRSPAFDRHVYKNGEGREWKSLRWAQKRGIDLRGFVLELFGDKRAGAVLFDLLGSIETKSAGIYTDLDVARYYATRGKLDDVDMPVGPLEFTALHNACHKGCDDIAKALVAAGADVDKEINGGTTALLWAARWGHEVMVKSLLAAGAEVDWADKHGFTALLWAAREGFEVVVKDLLAAGAEVDKTNNEGHGGGVTPLIRAAGAGREVVVKALLAAGADVNKADYDGYTPLMSAAREGHEEVVNALLAAGAEVDKASNDGCTPLHNAAKGGNEVVVKALLAAGAEVNKTDYYNGTALVWAAEGSHKVVVKILLSAGAKVKPLMSGNNLMMIDRKALPLYVRMRVAMGL